MVRIVARDGHVEHWLDDELVLAYDWDDPACTSQLLLAEKFAGKMSDLPSVAGPFGEMHDRMSLMVVRP